MNEDSQPSHTEPTVTEPALQEPIVPAAPTPVSLPPKKKKKWLAVSIILLLLLFLGLGAAYALLVYIPNKPENVLKTAMKHFAEDGNYTVRGRLDHGDGNAPDFNYELKTNNEDFHVRVDATTFVMNPSMEVLRVNGKTYVNASNWMDKAGLSERFLNYAEKGIQEYLAEFAENSGLYANQGDWVEIDSWVFDTTGGDGQTTPREADVTIESVGSVENRDGKKVRTYDISTTKEGFAGLLSNLDGSGLVKSIFEEYAKKNGFPDKIHFALEVDTSSKTIHKATYDGRPFRDATLSVELVTARNSFEAPTIALLASKTLRSGVLWSQLFNPLFQSADSSSDRERIADMKAIKMGLEIHKAMYGDYPSRMDIATNGEGYLRDRLPNADPGVFKDPNNRFIGMHGSQYAYVAYASDGSEMCGPHNGAKCEKYFVATTLDNGQEYKLVSD